MDILYTKTALTPINKDFVDFLTNILKTFISKAKTSKRRRAGQKWTRDFSGHYRYRSVGWENTVVGRKTAQSNDYFHR